MQHSASLVARAEDTLRDREAARQRHLVRQDEVEAVIERSGQGRRRIATRDIHEHGANHRVAGHKGHGRVGSRVLSAGDILERAARLLFAERERELPRGQAAPVVEIARSIDEPDDSQGRRFA